MEFRRHIAYMQVQEDDLAIIQMVLQGRQAAYSTLVTRYQMYVFTIAMRQVNNRELAEELAQDVFVKAYKSLGSFKGTSKFSTWLYTIVHHTCLSHLRKKDDPTIFPGDEQIHSWAEGSDMATQPLIRIEQKAQQQLLTQAISHLNETDSTIITLFYQADQSVEEISIVTGLTPGNVKVRLLRARQKLKDVLESRFSKEVIR